jgi:hypothetical protein
MPIDITGIDGTIRAMKKFDEDLYKEMNKQIKAAMIPIRDKARGFAPGNSEMLSGWTKANSSTPAKYHKFFPKYDQKEVKDGIVYRAGKNSKGFDGGQKFTRRWQVSYFVANNSAGGAIYETAGRRSGLGGRGTSHVVASRHKLAKDKKYTTSSGTRVDNNSLNPNAGKQLMEPMGPLVGARSPELFAGASSANVGRLIFRAWAEDQGRAAHGVNLAINTAVNIFNATNTADKYSLAA